MNRFAYVLECGTDFEGGYVVSVHSTLPGAKKAALEKVSDCAVGPGDQTWAMTKSVYKTGRAWEWHGRYCTYVKVSKHLIHGGTK